MSDINEYVPLANRPKDKPHKALTIRHEKTIFDVHRKGDTVIEEILRLETRTLLDRNPDYAFDRVEMAKQNKFGAVRYAIVLRLRQYQKPKDNG
jgi:hypothetical protein